MERGKRGQIGEGKGRRVDGLEKEAGDSEMARCYLFFNWFSFSKLWGCRGPGPQ